MNNTLEDLQNEKKLVKTALVLSYLMGVLAYGFGLYLTFDAIREILQDDKSSALFKAILAGIEIIMGTKEVPTFLKYNNELEEINEQIRVLKKDN